MVGGICIRYIDAILRENVSVFLCLRLTDMKSQSVTTRLQQTLQITKWRASSRRPTSFPESFGEFGGRGGAGGGRAGGFRGVRGVKDKSSAACLQVGRARPGLSRRS